MSKPFFIEFEKIDENVLAHTIVTVERIAHCSLGFRVQGASSIQGKSCSTQGHLLAEETADAVARG